MKKYCVVLLILVACVSLKAQYNFVPNPSFEVYDTCPAGGGQIRYAPPWNNPLYPSSPDYLNACDTLGPVGVPNNSWGFEYAKTGNAYMQIITYITNQTNPTHNHWREYIEAELSDSLTAGVDYCIQFYVSSVDYSKYVSNDMGIYFSNTKVQDTCPGQLPCNLPYFPQFENPATNSLSSDSGWTLVSGNYTASGGEKYIVIGNFKDSASTVATYKGYGGLDWAMYYVDDILITPCDSLTGLEGVTSISQINIYPNPSEGKYTLNTGVLKIEELKIFDVFGKLLARMCVIKNKEIIIDIETQSSGIYFIDVLTKNKLYKLKIIKL